MLIGLTRDVGPSDFVKFVWYRWKRGFAIEWRERGGRNEPFLVPAGGPQDELVWHHPLNEHPGLNRRFAAIKSVGEAVQFANAYGWLGLRNDPAADEGWARDVDLCEPLLDWLSEARELRFAIRLWELIASGETAELAKLVERRGNTVVLWPASPTSRKRGRLAKRVRALDDSWLPLCPPGDIVNPAKFLLIEAINQRLRRMASPVVVLDSAARFRPYLMPASLLAALWLELSEELTGAKVLRPCEVCGQIMDVTANRRHKRMHDVCSVRARMQRYLQRRRNGKEARAR